MKKQNTNLDLMVLGMVVPTFGQLTLVNADFETPVWVGPRSKKAAKSLFQNNTDLSD
jgi:hypothetical protein